MGDIFGISDRIHTARNLASGGDDQGLIYAALELRLCMEVVAYRQLSAYNEEIRSQLAKERNPSKIIRTLTHFDEESDQTAEISIAVNPPADLPEQIEGGKPDWTEGLEFLLVGNAYRIPWKKFGRAYSTLGSFLHIGKDAANLYPKRAKLDEIIAMLEEVAESTVIAAVNNVNVANCMCGALLVLGQGHQMGKYPINCGNTKCNAVFVADPNIPNRMELISQILLKCPCGANVPFPRERMLAVQPCPDCRTPLRAPFGQHAIAIHDKGE